MGLWNIFSFQMELVFQLEYDCSSQYDCIFFIIIIIHFQLLKIRYWRKLDLWFLGKFELEKHVALEWFSVASILKHFWVWFLYLLLYFYSSKVLRIWLRMNVMY